ncbi:hypothetical protein [Rhodoferax sp. BLA1]|uniref:hypothetical protein n=1 Tax=Rhodoferax sp. BLA1 TaxID=2576062 RepID=UPI0015D46191|nr:hypothetical protein [Rhodoferax sp. BLA1]
MDIFISVFIIGFGLNSFTQRDQQVRIALLGAYLAKFQIEKLMESLLQGYLRALGEPDAQRRAAIWSMLEPAETELCNQFNAFVLSFSKVPEPQARISKLPFALPYITKWLPGYSFDARKALSLHAHAITQAASPQPGQSHKDKAFTLMAELFLMQHTCHWFCRSRMVASARLLSQHKSPYPQVLRSVASSTREAYRALVGV